jgi:glycosyltransferase involved in cell wall biosynthesis
MKLGVLNNETWAFFEEIYKEFERHHQVSLFNERRVTPPLFKERVNKWLASRDIHAFLKTSDVVFIEWASRNLELASHLPKVCGIVTRMHRYEMYEWSHKINWDAVDWLILVSDAKQKEFVNKYPQQAHKVVVIPEAISLERFKRHENPFRGNLGTLCHLSPRKRVYELILNFYELNRQHDGFHFHIGGGKRPLFPDYADSLHALVKRLNLQDHVTFHGHISEHLEWYSKIDIFISNSYSEGLQVSPMEAIASGCYCLSHWWDGADELLPFDDIFITGSELLEKILAYSEASEDERWRRKDIQYARVRDDFNIQHTKVRIRELTEQVGLDWSGGYK